jgi:hypothetical protein
MYVQPTTEELKLDAIHSPPYDWAVAASAT